MDRRSFIMVMALGGLAAGIAPKLLASAPQGGAASAGPDLAYIQGDSPAAITKAAIETIGGMGKFVSKGGYIARIKVGSALGSATSIRKIGVIH